MLIVHIINHNSVSNTFSHSCLQFKQMMNKLDPFDGDDELSDHEITTTASVAVPSEVIADDNKVAKVIELFLITAIFECLQ